MAVEIKRVVFVGNPGCGKSFLINKLVGKDVVESGLGDVSGLTEFPIMVIDPDSISASPSIAYVDTIGVDDILLREEAVKCLNTVLATKQDVLLVFVVGMKDNRIYNTDSDTMIRTLRAVKDCTEPFQFLVVLNNVVIRENEASIRNGFRESNVYKEIYSIAPYFKVHIIPGINRGTDERTQKATLLRFEQAIKDLKGEIIETPGYSNDSKMYPKIKSGLEAEGRTQTGSKEGKAPSKPLFSSIGPETKPKSGKEKRQAKTSHTSNIFGRGNQSSASSSHAKSQKPGKNQPQSSSLKKNKNVGNNNGSSTTTTEEMERSTNRVDGESQRKTSFATEKDVKKAEVNAHSGSESSNEQNTEPNPSGGNEEEKDLDRQEYSNTSSFATLTKNVTATSEGNATSEAFIEKKESSTEDSCNVFVKAPQPL